MERNYLQEYEARELEEWQRFLSRRERNLLTSDEIFPSRRRFPNLHDPYSIAIQKLGITIWQQIPVTGSLIAKLAPIKRNAFEEYHSFSINEIPALIEFAKETGRVQFILHQPPTAYVGLDHLQPIFDELQPPLYTLPFVFVDEKTLMKGYIEFDTIARIDYYKRLSKLFYEWGETYVQRLADEYCRSFASLRALGLNDIVDSVIDNMLTNPLYTHDVLDLSKALIIMPLIDTMHALPSYDLNFFKRSRVLCDIFGKGVSDKIGSIRSWIFSDEEVDVLS